MKREIVKSLDIQSIGYGVFSSKLEIEFTSGEVYQYSQVPVDIYKKILSSNCYSTFFYKNIKNNYEFRRIL